MATSLFPTLELKSRGSQGAGYSANPRHSSNLFQNECRGNFGTLNEYLIILVSLMHLDVYFVLVDAFVD